MFGYGRFSTHIYEYHIGIIKDYLSSNKRDNPLYIRTAYAHKHCLDLAIHLGHYASKDYNTNFTPDQAGRGCCWIMPLARQP